MESYSVEEPMDLFKFALNEQLYIKCRHNRELHGKLIAFDNHFNLLLSDVEEIYREEEVDQSGRVQTKQNKRKMPMLYMRGDAIILVSPVAKGII